MDLTPKFKEKFSEVFERRMDRGREVTCEPAGVQCDSCPFRSDAGPVSKSSAEGGVYQEIVQRVRGQYGATFSDWYNFIVNYVKNDTRPFSCHTRNERHCAGAAKVQTLAQINPVPKPEPPVGYSQVHKPRVYPPWNGWRIGRRG